MAVLAAVSLNAAGQSWPQKPVKFILSLGPGSGADIGARLYADRLTKLWGQPVVVENRPGGDGIIAARSSGISNAVRDRIAADVKRVSADPLLAERLAATAQLNVPGNAAEFAASIDEQAAQLAASAKLLGMKPKQ